MIFVAETRDGDRIEYRDAKRWLWVFSFVPALLPFAFYGSYFVTDQSPLWAAGPLLFAYVFIPVMDVLLGEDRHNPPEEVVNQLASDQFYTRLLYIAVAIYAAAYGFTVWFLSVADLPLWAQIVTWISAGVISGTSLTVGHELGHKAGKWERFGAKLINGISWYGHFTQEHNTGHHTHVATPEDSASSRLGESFYAFMAREMPDGLKRGLAVERQRLQRRELSFWSLRNEILQSYAISALIAAATIWALGWIAIPFLVVHTFYSWQQLSLANYVEHYGLKRARRPDGRYEPVHPKHSWNTNHIFSNLLLFHLQRHSDHHANPMRPYQALRDFEDLPRLPSGYPGCFVLAFIPPLWFRVMDPKVMAWADGDLDRINTGS